MTTFTIPRLTAERLARIGLACAEEAGPLGHIALRITPTAVRFAATNGRILASFLVPLENLNGDPFDLVLDREQLTAALKATIKPGGGRITVDISPNEARLTNGSTSAIVRRIDGTFPQIEHVWTRPAGRRWIPTLSTLDPQLVGVVQKITGSKIVKFVSPVEPSARLERLWSVAGPDEHEETISLSAMRSAVTAPAYWCDGELAILLMPITRASEGRPLDLSEHALALPVLAAAA